MPEVPNTQTRSHAPRIIAGLLSMILFWGLGWWAMESEQLGLVFFALIAFLVAWIFTGFTWLRWVNARKGLASTTAQPRG